MLVPALQARLTTSLRSAARLHPLALTHSISITRTHASIVRQTVMFALIKLGFVLSVKLTTNFLLTILVNFLVQVINTVTPIKPASIARQTVMFALIRLGFVLSVKLATNFFLTILVHSLVLVLSIVALIRHASIALLIVLNAHKMAAHSVMKVFIFSRIKHAV